MRTSYLENRLVLNGWYIDTLLFYVNCNASCFVVDKFLSGLAMDMLNRIVNLLFEGL